MQDVSSIASGGEIARLMLALKRLIAQRTALPTIVFDEIDTGVSGTMAECMAQSNEPNISTLPSALHHPPSTNCRIGQQPFARIQRRHRRHHTQPHRNTQRNTAHRRNRTHAFGCQTYRCRHRKCQSTHSKINRQARICNRINTPFFHIQFKRYNEKIHIHIITLHGYIALPTFVGCQYPQRGL